MTTDLAPAWNPGQLALPGRASRRAFQMSQAVSPILSAAKGRWDAQAITGLSEGNAITSWTDQTGNGHNGTQSSGNAPTYAATGINGRPAAYFGASNAQKWLDLGNSLHLDMRGNDKPWTLVGVVRPLNNGVGGSDVMGFGTNANQPNIRFSFSTLGPGANPQISKRDTAAVNKSVSHDGTTRGYNIAQVVMWRSSGTNAVLGINGGVRPAGDLDVGDLVTLSYGTMGLLRRTAYENFYDGWIGELILWLTARTDAEWTNTLYPHLASKWGITT